VIGIGNPDRGDDGVGRVLARRLRARAAPGIEVRECDGEATGLMAAWEGAEEVVLVDACRGAGPPGSVHRLDAAEIAGPGSPAPSPAVRSTSSSTRSKAVASERAPGCRPRSSGRWTRS
jgi:hydrogenase maturation protease